MLYPLSYEGWDNKRPGQRLSTQPLLQTLLRSKPRLGRGRVGETPTVAVHGVTRLG
jgi:hypothetical protein